ncbi:MAG TPA: ATP-binding protein [Burkholderiaceae bacterium]|jgi:signal transduction histidine kinase|nr:ATP-binding protein [Burkholderiaceae bacterium]
MDPVPDNRNVQDAPESAATGSIAGRLLKIIFGCYFVVTLVVTVIQLAAEYSHTKDRLVQEIKAMQQTFGPGIADAMWRYNDDILRGILSGMKELPVVVGIKVEDEQGKIVRAVGTISDGNGHKLQADADGHLAQQDGHEGLFEEMFSQDFPIMYIGENGESHRIGKWTVYSNQRIIVNQVEYDFLLILVNSVIKTLALWFIFLFVVQRWLGKPLRQLSDFVGQLKIENLGNSVFVLKDRGRHELHLLADKLNEMIANLRTSITEKASLYAQLQAEQSNIQKLNESLEHRIAERTADLTNDRQQLAKANLDLARALDTLNLAHEELLRREKLAALGSMVAGIAHELNTPVGNCLTVASVLAEDTRIFANSYAAGLKRSTVEQFIDDTSQATDLLLRNIMRTANLVTSFKQVAVDQTSSQRRTFLLAEIVSENIQALSPTIRKTPFAVEQSIPAEIEMDSYPGPLGQVLINLVNNAIVHGFEGREQGTIKIGAQKVGAGWVELHFSDDGNGIAPKNLGRIYDPFFTTKLGSGGSGLGLNITHNIVTGVLGGKIQVESAINAGTRFIMILPLVAPHQIDVTTLVS